MRKASGLLPLASAMATVANNNAKIAVCLGVTVGDSLVVLIAYSSNSWLVVPQAAAHPHHAHPETASDARPSLRLSVEAARYWKTAPYQVVCAPPSSVPHLQRQPARAGLVGRPFFIFGL
jgi:hypothetical protein